MALSLMQLTKKKIKTTAFAAHALKTWEVHVRAPSRQRKRKASSDAAGA